MGAIVTAVAATAALGTAGCDAAGSGAAQTETWTAEQDDSLEVLTMEVSGGAVVAMTGNGWAQRDGFIQLQLSGGSIPGQAIESVTREGGALTVKLEETDEPTTLDLVLTEFRLTGGNVEAVESVTVDYGHGSVQEVQKSYD